MRYMDSKNHIVSECYQILPARLRYQHGSPRILWTVYRHEGRRHYRRYLYVGHATTRASARDIAHNDRHARQQPTLQTQRAPAAVLSLPIPSTAASHAAYW
jgi:hypothetical protein